MSFSAISVDICGNVKIETLMVSHKFAKICVKSSIRSQLQLEALKPLKNSDRVFFTSFTGYYEFIIKILQSWKHV